MVGRAFSLEIWESASVSITTRFCAGTPVRAQTFTFFCLRMVIHVVSFIIWLLISLFFFSNKNGTTVFYSLKHNFVVLFTFAAVSSQIDWKPINEDDSGSQKMCLCL